DPTRATGAVHGSSPVGHWSDCAGIPRSVERRRTVPPGEERWCGALGAVASVGGWVHTATHLCHGARTDAGESGEDRARNRRLRARDDERSGRDCGRASPTFAFLTDKGSTVHDPVPIKHAVALPLRTKSCYMKDMHVFERSVNGRRYRVAAQSVWDPVHGRSVARQTVLGPATAAPVADLSATRTVGTQAIGDVGALIWVAEQLDLIGHIDRACGSLGAKGGPSVGELAVAVAIQRACSPGPKRDLAEFLNGAVPRLSCLPSSTFTGQAYHRVARQVTDEQLETAQIAIAKAAVAR